MRNRMAGALLVLLALAGCRRAEAPPGSQDATNAAGQAVDSGPAPTPALDSVGPKESDAGRVD